MHPSLELNEKIQTLDVFYDKLIASGHLHVDVRLLFVEALLKFNLLVKNSLLPPDHPSYKPLYLSNDFDKTNRGIAKFLQRYNWHDPEASASDSSWRKEVPSEFKKPTPNKRFSSIPSLRPSTVLFVPNSHQGILLKKLEHAEPMLSSLTGYTCRLVESSGVPLSRLFSLDLSNRRCHRADCIVCEFHQKSSSSKCKKRSVVYESRCVSCSSSGSGDGVYVGETGRSLYERSLEHLDDAANKKISSHIFRHWAISHPDDQTQPIFHFKVLKPHKSPLDRQLHEAVRIGSHGLLNSRSEFRQNKVKRIAVCLTAREQKDADRAVEKEEAMTAAAVQVLSDKLSCNKHVSNVASNHIDCTQQGQDSSVNFTDICGKRALDSLSDQNLISGKRLRGSIMGRSSKGRTNNESNNLWKFWPPKPKKEALRSKNSPATFAEASLLARSWYEKRELGNSFLSMQGITPIQPVSDSILQYPTNMSPSSSTGSPCNINAVTPEAPVSPTPSPMSSLDTDTELSFSKLVSSLKVDVDKADLNDSFSSSKDSAFNKGALAFLSLVEKALEKANGLEVKFEDLILQMMDLGVEEKLNTASDILDVLNMNGWNMRQVSQVWSVPSLVIEQDSWDIGSLKRLGGHKVLADVWSSLRDSNQAGHPKRTAVESLEDAGSQNKRRRVATGTNCVVPSPAPIAQDLPSTVIEQPSPVVGNVPVHSRKHARARRHSLIVPSRLKDWLIIGDSQDTSQDQVQAEGCSQVAAQREGNSPVPTTPASPRKRRTRRRKTKNSSTPILSQDPLSPEAKTPPKSSRKSKKKTILPADKKQRTLPSFMGGNSPNLKPAQRLIGQPALSNGSSDDQQQLQEMEPGPRCVVSKHLE